MLLSRLSNNSQFLAAMHAATASLYASAGVEGLEPPTLGFGDRCSTN